MKGLQSKLILLFVAVAVFISCEKDEKESPIAISLKSGQASVFAETGDKVLYEIEVYSVHSTIKQFTITSLETDNGEKTLLDVSPDEAKYHTTYTYEVPEFSKDSLLVKLTMKAVDYDDNDFSLVCYITVKTGTLLLQELSGIVMYSGLSNNPNAFSLSDPTQVFLRALADSSMVDVYDYPLDSTNTTLSREWHTNTDVYFTKSNNFNYSTATLTSIKNTYNSSVRDKFVGNLQPNDLILFCKRDSIFGVIQITDIADNEGITNDYYRFNIKK